MADKKEYIEWGEAILAVMRDRCTANAVGVLFNMPAADVVSRGVFEQVQWERDMAMQQLEEHGIPFGAKVDVVAVRYGAWLQTKESLGAYDVDCVECSVCGESWVLDEEFDFDVVKDFWNYCPNCGADMIGATMDATDNNVGDK